MFFHFQDDVQIASRSAVRAGLTLPGHAQPRARIHARRNTQLDGSLALQAAPAAAIRAALADNLCRALACRASARDGEKSLLVGKLAAAGASLASNNAGAGLCPRAVANFAVFLARQFDLCARAGGVYQKKDPRIRKSPRRCRENPEKWCC